MKVNDVNAPISLVEEYYEVLNAPQKELIWFEHSGHTPLNYEVDRVISEIKKRF